MWGGGVGEGGWGGGSNALNLMFDAELNVIRLRLCNFDIKQLHIFLFFQIEFDNHTMHLKYCCKCKI